MHRQLEKKSLDREEHRPLAGAIEEARQVIDLGAKPAAALRAQIRRMKQWWWWALLVCMSSPAWYWAWTYQRKLGLSMWASGACALAHSARLLLPLLVMPLALQILLMGKRRVASITAGLALGLALSAVLMAAAGWITWACNIVVGGKPFALWPVVSEYVIAGSLEFLLVGVAVLGFDVIVTGHPDLTAIVRRVERRLLQSRLSPHAMAGYFNHLSELVVQDPGRAEAAVGALGRYFEVLQPVVDRDWHTLAQEREVLTAHLDMDAHLVSRLDVDWVWPPDMAAIRIPPLLLLPLLENAMRHGVAPADGGQLRFFARTRGGLLELELWNTGPDIPAGRPRPGRGEGLRNLRDRLDLQYQGRATFDLTREGEWTRARIVVPMEA